MVGTEIPLNFKRETYNSWKFLGRLEAYFLQPRLFWTEIRRYGSLDDALTWQRAYASIRAGIAASAMWDNPTIIRELFCRPDAGFLSEYNDLILQEYLKFPEAMDHIKAGLEELYFRSDSVEDHQAAVAFLKRLTKYSSDLGNLSPSIAALAA